MYYSIFLPAHSNQVPTCQTTFYQASSCNVHTGPLYHLKPLVRVPSLAVLMEPGSMWLISQVDFNCGGVNHNFLNVSSVMTVLEDSESISISNLAPLMTTFQRRHKDHSYLHYPSQTCLWFDASCLVLITSWSNVPPSCAIITLSPNERTPFIWCVNPGTMFTIH